MGTITHDRRVPLYRALASALEARENCEDYTDPRKREWNRKHTARADALVRAHMPSGAGIDRGTLLDLDKSTPERLVFTFGYHHMHESGVYDGWTEHTAIVTPSLAHTIAIRITGRDRNQIKDYLYQTFDEALRAEVNEYPESVTGLDPALAIDK